MAKVHINKLKIKDMESIYEVGDVVYHSSMGKGEVISIKEGGMYPLVVKFSGTQKKYFTLDGKYSVDDKCPSLSFTPYDTISGGFSQEKAKKVNFKEDNIFRIGDRVYNIHNGWGTVYHINQDYADDDMIVLVKYDTGLRKGYTKTGKVTVESTTRVLSFTEYDLVNGGFTQERPFPDIKRGTPIFVKFCNGLNWRVRVFSHKNECGIYVFTDSEVDGPVVKVSEWSLDNPMTY